MTKTSQSRPSDVRVHHLFGGLRRGLGSPIVSIIGLLFVQLMWTCGMFTHREISAGDSSSYLQDTLVFLSGGPIAFLWVPIFKLAYAPFVAIFASDLPFAENVFRLAIYLANGSIVLFIFRRMFTGRPVVAWFLAIWYVLNPIGFDGLYEIHIFSLTPFLLALLLLGRNNPYARAMACAVLAISSLFLRNEFIFATAIVFLFCLCLDHPRKNWRPYLAAAGLTILVAIVFLALSNSKLNELGEQLSDKANFQFGQGFAVGYSEMTPGYSGNPFLDYKSIVVATFRKPVGPAGALLQNPSAMLRFFQHNVSHLTAGIQSLLISPFFNKWAYEGTFRRSYAECAPGNGVVWAASMFCAVALFFIAVGLFAALKKVFRGQASELGWLWVGLLSTLPVCIFSTLFQRPIPHYILPLQVLLMALAGFGFVSLAKRPLPILITIPLIASLLFLPHYYGGVVAVIACPRPAADAIRRITPFKAKIIQEGLRLYGPYLCEEELLIYLGVEKLRENYISVMPAKADDVLASEETFNASTTEAGTGMVYAAGWTLMHPAFLKLRESGRMDGWRVVKSGSPHNPWYLMVKEPMDKKTALATGEIRRD